MITQRARLYEKGVHFSGARRIFHVSREGSDGFGGHSGLKQQRWGGGSEEGREVFDSTSKKFIIQGPRDLLSDINHISTTVDIIICPGHLAISYVEMAHLTYK